MFFAQGTNSTASVRGSHVPVAPHLGGRQQQQQRVHQLQVQHRPVAPSSWGTSCLASRAYCTAPSTAHAACHGWCRRRTPCWRVHRAGGLGCAGGPTRGPTFGCGGTSQGGGQEGGVAEEGGHGAHRRLELWGVLCRGEGMGRALQGVTEMGGGLATWTMGLPQTLPTLPAV